MPILRKWTDSRAVNALTDAEEVLFGRILQHCDDYGRFHADPQLLRAVLFPLKANKRVTDIAYQLAMCERAGVVRCYVDASGRQLLQVSKWRDGKKFKKSAFDPPEGQAHLSLEEKRRVFKSDKDDKALSPLSVPERGSGGKPAENGAVQKLSLYQRDLAMWCESILNGQWVNDAGKWVNRIKSNCDKVKRVFCEVQNAVKEGRIHTTPAQYAEETWKRFA